jgi:hypothetical protein
MVSPGSVQVSPPTGTALETVVSKSFAVQELKLTGHAVGGSRVASDGVTALGHLIDSFNGEAAPALTAAARSTQIATKATATRLLRRPNRVDRIDFDASIFTLHIPPGLTHNKHQPYVIL